MLGMREYFRLGEDLIQIGGRTVCAACKPIAVQKLKEGVTSTGEYRYAGFWIRFGAKFVDGLILFAVNMVISFVFTAAAPLAPGSPATLILALLGMVIRATYVIWFVGNMGATPGKLACGIKIIQADGGSVGYGRATGRFFAEPFTGAMKFSASDTSWPALMKKNALCMTAFATPAVGFYK